MVTEEQLEKEESEVLKEYQVQEVLVEIQEAEDLQDNKGQPANLVWMEFQEQVEKMVYQELKDQLDQLVLLVLQVQKD